MVVPIRMAVHDVVVREHHLHHQVLYIIGEQLIEVGEVLHLVVADHYLPLLAPGNEIALLRVGEIARR